jgi:integrase
MLHERKLGPASIIKHLSNLSVIFRWAEANGFIDDNTNPVKGLPPPKKAAKKAAMARRPFTDDELLKVFGSPNYLKERERRPARYWLPLICLFAGVRREEAGALYVKDIQEADGVHFFNITDTEADQHLKNDGSRRRVPIHSALVRLGFLDFVAEVRRGKHARLFWTLTRSANGYSDTIGKWFGRFVNSVGIDDPACVLHSTRHGFITRLHSVGVAHSTVEMLAGHAAGNVHGQYVHRELIDLRLLSEAVERLDYAAVVKVLMAGTLIAAR